MVLVGHDSWSAVCLATGWLFAWPWRWGTRENIFDTQPYDDTCVALYRGVSFECRLWDRFLSDDLGTLPPWFLRPISTALFYALFFPSDHLPASSLLSRKLESKHNQPRAWDRRCCMRYVDPIITHHQVSMRINARYHRCFPLDRVFFLIMGSNMFAGTGSTKSLPRPKVWISPRPWHVRASRSWMRICSKTPWDRRLGTTWKGWDADENPGGWVFHEIFPTGSGLLSKRIGAV